MYSLRRAGKPRALPEKPDSGFVLNPQTEKRTPSGIRLVTLSCLVIAVLAALILAGILLLILVLVFTIVGGILSWVLPILLPVLLIVWVIRTFFGGGRKGW